MLIYQRELQNDPMFSKSRHADNQNEQPLYNTLSATCALNAVSPNVVTRGKVELGAEGDGEDWFVGAKIQSEGLNCSIL